jgi:hypothetical protein
MCWPWKGPFVATGPPEVNIIDGICGYSIAKTKPKSFFNAIIEAPVSILVEVNSVSVEVFLPNSLERNLLIFCFLWSYALRLKPQGFLRQKTDPMVDILLPLLRIQRLSRLMKLCPSTSAFILLLVSSDITVPCTSINKHRTRTTRKAPQK